MKAINATIIKKGDNMIEQLKSFVENGGRIRAKEEPRFGEPFYGDYMKQFLQLHYKPGDKVQLQEKVYSGAVCTYEGIIIALDYDLILLISGRKVHKDKRNKKCFNYTFIKSIEMVEPDDGSFDLSVVDPDYWEWKTNNINFTGLDHKKTEVRRKIRNEDQEEFHSVYPKVNFDKSHVIKITDGCRMYWPFVYKSISAEVFMVRDGNNIISIPCQTGTPFPNKNSFHAYNCKIKDHYPDLYLYLPETGSGYADVDIVCVWTITTTISEKDTAIRVVNIYHVGEIKPVEDERNMIFIDMSVYPLLPHGKSLFADSSSSFLLTCMMNTDMYTILSNKDDSSTIVKLLQEQTSEEVKKYLSLAGKAVNGFNKTEVVQSSVCSQGGYCPQVEVFCNIDKTPERYYSSSWRSCREKYLFKMFES